MNLFMVLSLHTIHMCEWCEVTISRDNQSMCESHNKSQFAAITSFCTSIRPCDVIVIDVGVFAVVFLFVHLSVSAVASSTFQSNGE